MMNIWAGKGDRVRFVNDRAGMPNEAKKALENLILGDIYIVKWVDVGTTRSYVALEGYPGTYNTVLFEDVDVNEEKASVRKQFYPKRSPWE